MRVAIVPNLGGAFAKDNAAAIASWRRPLVGFGSEADTMAPSGGVGLLWTTVTIVLPKRHAESVGNCSKSADDQEAGALHNCKLNRSGKVYR